MAINYKSSKELQLLLLFLSCPKFLGCTSVYFWPVIIVCKGCQVIAGQSFTQRAQPLATDHWILTGVLPSPALCMSDPKQLGLGSTHFTFMASVYALIGCITKAIPRQVKPSYSGVVWEVLQMMRLDLFIGSPYQPLELFKGLLLISIRLGPGGTILHRKKKWFRALKSCC